VANLEARFAARNARFRAFAALGAPIPARWEPPAEPDAATDWSPEARRFWLVVECRACFPNLQSDAFSCDPGEDPAGVEQYAAHSLRPCPHLAPLLGAEPEGLADIAALELLAGEAAGGGAHG
jgi:hypothetical protein